MAFLKQASQNQVRQFTLFANLERDPTNIVETKKQDGRMVGPLMSMSS